MQIDKGLEDYHTDKSGGGRKEQVNGQEILWKCILCDYVILHIEKKKRKEIKRMGKANEH